MTRMPRGFDAWNVVRGEYPFHHQTDGIKGAPRPEALKAYPFDDFVRVPVPEIDVVWWGFRTKADADLFAQHFPVDKFDVRGQG